MKKATLDLLCDPITHEPLETLSEPTPDGVIQDWLIGTESTKKYPIKKWGIEADLFHGEAEYLPFNNEVFDVVFHVGGINFFNDKARAINEMIRDAKPGTKLAIIDENEGFAKTFYKKIPFIGDLFLNREEIISAPIDLIPSEMLEVKVENKLGGMVYCLSFRKPN